MILDICFSQVNVLNRLLFGCSLYSSFTIPTGVKHISIVNTLGLELVSSVSSYDLCCLVSMGFIKVDLFIISNGVNCSYILTDYFINNYKIINLRLSCS